MNLGQSHRKQIFSEPPSKDSIPVSTIHRDDGRDHPLKPRGQIVEPVNPLGATMYASSAPPPLHRGTMAGIAATTATPVLPSSLPQTPPSTPPLRQSGTMRSPQKTALGLAPPPNPSMPEAPSNIAARQRQATIQPNILDSTDAAQICTSIPEEFMAAERLPERTDSMNEGQGRRKPPPPERIRVAVRQATNVTQLPVITRGPVHQVIEGDGSELTPIAEATGTKSGPIGAQLAALARRSSPQIQRSTTPPPTPGAKFLQQDDAPTTIFSGNSEPDPLGTDKTTIHRIGKPTSVTPAMPPQAVFPNAAPPSPPKPLARWLPNGGVGVKPVVASPQTPALPASPPVAQRPAPVVAPLAPPPALPPPPRVPRANPKSSRPPVSSSSALPGNRPATRPPQGTLPPVSSDDERIAQEACKAREPSKAIEHALTIASTSRTEILMPVELHLRRLLDSSATSPEEQMKLREAIGVLQGRQVEQKRATQRTIPPVSNGSRASQMPDIQPVVSTIPPAPNVPAIAATSVVQEARVLVAPVAPKANKETQTVSQEPKSAAESFIHFLMVWGINLLACGVVFFFTMTAPHTKNATGTNLPSSLNNACVYSFVYFLILSLISVVMNKQHKDVKSKAIYALSVLAVTFAFVIFIK